MIGKWICYLFGHGLLHCIGEPHQLYCKRCNCMVEPEGHRYTTSGQLVYSHGQQTSKPQDA